MMNGHMSADELVRAALAAASSAVVLLALVVMELDLQHLTAFMRRRRDRMLHKWGGSFFISLVGYGEALQVFRIIAGEGPIAGWRPIMSDVAWGCLAGYFLAARPLLRLEPICSLKGSASCPLVQLSTERVTGSAPTTIDMPIPAMMRAAPSEVRRGTG